jgi:hypothetical protein
MRTGGGAPGVFPSSEDGTLTVTAADGAAIHLSEFVGAPQDALVERRWVMQEEREEVVLSARWSSVWMEKRIAASDGSASLRLDYTFRNDGPIFVRPAFGLRLSLPAGPTCRRFVPTAESLREIELCGEMPAALYLKPSRPWCAVAVGDYGIALLFPDRVLDAVEIEHGERGEAIRPLVYHLGLSPGFEACLTCVVDFAAPPPGEMDPWCEARAASLRCSYRRAWRGTPEAAEATGPATVPVVPSLSLCAERRQSNRRLAQVAARLAEGQKKRLELLEQVAQGEIGAWEAGTILLHGQ